MKQWRLPASSVALSLFFLPVLSVTPLLAHHSLSAEYDNDKPISITGKVRRIDYVNPHSWLYMDVVEKNTGKAIHYAVEFGSLSALLRNGIRKDSVSVNSEVTIDGWLAKNGTPTVGSWSMTLSNGRRFFTSNTADAGAAPGASLGTKP